MYSYQNSKIIHLYRTGPFCSCQFECKIISQFGQPPSSVWVEGWINLQLVGATSYMKETTKLNIKCKLTKLYWLYIFANDLNMLYCYRLNKQWLSGLALVSNQQCLFTWLLWSPLGSLLCLIIPHCVVLVNFIFNNKASIQWEPDMEIQAYTYVHTSVWETLDSNHLVPTWTLWFHPVTSWF